MDERKRLEIINNAIESLKEIEEEIKKNNDLLEKIRLKIIKQALEEELKEVFAELLEELIKENPQEAAKLKAKIIENPGNIESLFNAFIEDVKAKTEETSEYKLPEEIIEILNIVETDEAVLDDNPIIKTMTRKGDIVANYGTAGQIKIIEHSGNLTPFHAEVFSTAIKAYRNNKVTKEGYIVLTENQAIKIMLGTKGTPSEKQKKDFRQAWEDMRTENMTYETTETLAQIIGIEQEQLEDFVPGIKPTSTNIVEEYFIQGLKVIKRQTVNGKQTDIYLIKPSDIVKKCIDKFPWYEEISPEVQRVMQSDKEGNLKIWGYSKKRIKIKQYLYAWVYKNKRARANNKKQHRLQLPYEVIFKECGIDTSHRQEKVRRFEDVETILDHLKRTDEIANWKQYTDKNGTIKGIEIMLYKERLQ